MTKRGLESLFSVFAVACKLWTSVLLDLVSKKREGLACCWARKAELRRRFFYERADEACKPLSWLRGLCCPEKWAEVDLLRSSSKQALCKLGSTEELFAASIEDEKKTKCEETTLKIFAESRKLFFFRCLFPPFAIEAAKRCGLDWWKEQCEETTLKTINHFRYVAKQAKQKL